MNNLYQGKKMPLAKEYSTYGDEEASKRTLLATEYSPRLGRNVRLMHKTAGYEPAGSCARFTQELWGALYDLDWSTAGQWFKTEAEARKYFNKLITK